MAFLRIGCRNRRLEAQDRLRHHGRLRRGTAFTSTRFAIAEPKGPFGYTYKWWDKNRPGTLPSTGLGEELKKYEAAKKSLGSSPQLRNYFQAKSALAEVEKVRAKAVKKCGPLHKAIKKILEAAPDDDEAGELKAAFQPTLEKLVDEYERESQKLLKSISTRADNVAQAIESYEAGKASPAELKLLAWFKRNDFATVMPRMNNAVLHEELQKSLRVLEKDFPDLVARYRKTMAESREEISAQRAAYGNLVKDLKDNPAIDVSKVQLDQ